MRKRISKILISILFVVLLIASIYKVSAAESCSISMNYSTFFGTRQLKSYGNYYMYCLEPGVTLGDTYTKLTPITIDTNNTGWNTTANKKMIKEAYVFCADGATSTGRDGNGDYTLYKQGTKRLSGYDSYSSRISQDFVRYMVGVLFSPRQIAIWNIEDGKTITSYKVKWWNGYNYTNAQYQLSGTKGYCKFISGGGMNLVESVNELFGGYGSDSSAATTTLGTYIRNNRTTSTKYITDANTFLTNVQNGKNGITNETTGTPAADYTTNSTYIYIGPYKIKHGGLTSAIVYDNSGNDISSKVDIVNSAKTTKYTNNLPTSEATFYLRIKRSNMPSSIKKVTFAGSSARYIFNLYKLENNRTEQVLLGGNYKKYSTSTNLDLTVDVPLLPKLKVKLYKTNDFKTDSLPGATFNISFTQDGTSLGNFTNKSAGEEVTCEQPIKSNKPIEVKIEEINAPEGYHNFGTVVAKFDYNSTSKSWVFNSTSSDDLVYIKGTPSTTTTLTSAEIGVINKAKIEELILKKVSLNGTELEGAEFKVTISNGSILDEDGAEIGASKTVTTESDGTINIGAVKVNNLNNKVTVKLQELTAPDGYAKWASDISFNLKYNKSASKWEQDGNITIPSFARAALESKYLLAITKSGNTTSVSIEVPDISDIFENLIIRKVNTNEEPLANAEFKIELSNAKIYSTNSTSTTATTDADGNIEIGRVDVDDITRPVNVTLTELVAPAGYAKYNDPIKVKITYNQTNLSWDAVFETRPDFGSTALRDCYEVSTSGDDGETVVDIKIPDASQIDELKIRKVDQNGDIISGAKMMITDITNCLNPENVKGIEKTTDADGEITFGNVIASDINEKITVTLIETQAPVGYKKISGNIVVDFEYDSSEEKWIGEVVSMPEIEDEYAESIFEVTSEDLAGVHGTTCATIIVPDLAEVEDFKLNKKNSVNTENMPDVEFKAEIISGNAKFRQSEDDTNLTDSVTKRTDANGNINFGKLAITELGSDVEIEVTEISVPVGYRKLDPFIVTVTRTGENNNIAYDVTYDVSSFDASINNTTHEIIMNIENIPMMNLGGKVWLDKFNGDYKAGATRNSKYDAGEELPGMYVYLYNADGLVTEDIYGNEIENPVQTDENGRYEFTYLPVDEYLVVFEYEGIKYITVPDNTNNVAQEDGRDTFNSKFEKITGNGVDGGNTYGEANGSIGLVYENGESIATLVETDKFGNYTDYPTASMIAKYSHDYRADNLWQTTWDPATWNSSEGTGTPNYTSEPLNLDCGLRERIFDLSLGTDVVNAKVAINGEETMYTYDQIIDGNINADLNRRFSRGEEISSDNPIEYNLNLYTSDYYYRIADYVASLPPYLRVDGVDDPDRTEPPYNDINELSIDVTYKVLVTNQSFIDNETTDRNPTIKVTGLKDYYDTNYTLKGIQYGSYKNGQYEADAILNPVDISTISIENATIDGKDYNEIDLSNIGIEDINLGGASSENDLTNVIVYLTFGVDKNSDEAIILGEKGNIAEITSYVTDKGFIDIDSAPDNCIVDETLRYEDDTDEAEKLNIQLKEDEPRTISGYVFDAGKDGTKEVTETKVNDVIVQLIEVKELSGKKYEYIWQQTRSGSGNVQIMNNHGTGIETNTYDVQEGYYEFKNFIPGNYIVRFIYGDGRIQEIGHDGYNVTTERAAEDQLANIQKYNGQDYKSTYYDSYNHTNSYNVDTSFGEEISVASDNEARRLDVMSYSVKINNAKGNEIKDKTDDMLDNTWMCAETLKIEVPVDAREIGMSMDGLVDVDAWELDSAEPPANAPTEINFDQVNFGLQLRPETKIELEKHITGLYVQTESGQILTDAKADIDDILDNRIINNKQGVTDGLLTLVSDRDFRNSWRLETDLSELGQGSELEATYTYVVKNTGDTDYLSSTLVDEYKGDVNGYSTNLGTHATAVKNAMKTVGYSDFGALLGTYYYTGFVGGSDLKVPTQINEIQEAINNKMSFADDNTYFEKVTETDDANSAYVINGTATAAYNRRVWRNNDATGIEAKIEQMNTIIKSESGTGFMVPTEKDTSKVVNLQSTITTDGGEYESYLAEITEYTNAAGRADMKIVPENLSYVHSDDTTRTLEDLGDTKLNNPDEVINERDEFWGESIVITKPTGEDKVTPVQLIVTITFAVAIIGVGALVIKKFALKK